MVGQVLDQPANWPNTGWTLSGSYTSAGLLSDPTTSGSTFTFDDDAAGNGAADNIIATSPVIDLTAASNSGETWITVSGNYTYYALGGDELAIETYDADTMTWSAIQTFTGNTTSVANYQNCSVSEAYTSQILDISGFTSTQLSGFQYRISYNDQAGWQYGWCVESPTISSASPPSCLDPTALTATNVTDTTADLGWTENGTATVWDIEIVDVTASGSPTGTPTASGVSNPYSATGLTADNNYEFYVLADCVSSTSNWVGPFAFSTTCSPIPATYTEDFETFTPTPGLAFDSENCWDATNTAGSYFWESAAGTDTSSGGTGPSPTITTGNYFFIEASGSSTGDEAELNSPLVDLSSLTTPSLSFDYHMFGDQIGTLEVIVNGTTTEWTLSGQQQPTENTPWETAVIDLSAYANQEISVTFKATGAGTFEGDIAIDNVSFDELPTCSDPSALTATNITDTTADLGWTENGTATVWDVEIVDVTGGGSVTGNATATGVTNPYSATGLTQNNDYAFYVLADCGGSDTSNWVGPFAFTTEETCPEPSFLNVTNIMETSADLGWTENGTATTWNIEVIDITAGGTVTGTPTDSGVTSNPYSLTGLTGDNSYEFYVQADCGVDGTSAWAGPFSFSTPYVAVPPSCSSGTFLDSGGLSGDYSSNENITYTICPDNPGDVVTVTFTSFNTENNGATACYDGLTVHDGADNSAPTINPIGGGTIWCWDRDDSPAQGTGDLQGMTLTSTDPSGCLTFVFTSDGSVTRDGWEATVSCGGTGTTFVYDGGSWNSAPEGNATASDNVTVMNGTATLSSGISTNNLTIMSGATLVASNGDIAVNGDIVNDGTINGTNMVSMNGSNLQSLDGTGSISNLEVNNTAGVSLDGSQSITKELQMTNGTLTTNSNLTLKSDATGTAMVSEINTANTDISGDVTVERFIQAGTANNRAFRLVTSAVDAGSIYDNWQEAGASPAGFGTHITGSDTGANGFDQTSTGNVSMFTFDHTVTNQAGGAAWTEVANTNATNLSAGVPYRLFVRGDRTIDLTNNSSTPNNTVLRATGSLKTGTVSAGTLAQLTGQFSFIGNPYQAIVNVNDLSFTGDVNQSFIYAWDANANDNGAFVTIELPAGTNAGLNPNVNNFLQPGQAVFIRNNQTSFTTPGTIDFTEASKNTTASQLSPFSEPDYTIVDVRLFTVEGYNANQLPIDAVGLRFDDEFNIEVDDADAGKLANSAENLAIVQDNTILSIEKRSFPEGNSPVQLFLNNYQHTEFVFVAEASNMPEGKSVFIKDNYLDTVTEVNLDTPYVFTVDPNLAETTSIFRFEVVFENETLGVNNYLANAIKLYPIPVEDQLNLSNNLGTDLDIEVYNMLGQRVSKIHLGADEEKQIPMNNLEAGVYVVKVIDGDTSFNTQIIKK